jgi:hypothetical protein
MVRIIEKLETNIRRHLAKEGAGSWAEFAILNAWLSLPLAVVVIIAVALKFNTFASSAGIVYMSTLVNNVLFRIFARRVIRRGTSNIAPTRQT